MNTTNGKVDSALSAREEILASILDVLGQGERLLEGLSDDSYQQKLPIAFNASMGGHYRHCLEHFQSILVAFEGEEVDYDARKRDGRLETQRAAALRLTGELKREFAACSVDKLDRPVRVRCKVNYAVEVGQVVESNLGRELMYGVAHAVHHYALMGVMGRVLDLELPAEFGVAPSTLQHQRQRMQRQSSLAAA